MIRSSSILMLLTCVVCSFCEKDFVTLGRHSWRCKQRVNYAEQDHSAENTARQTPVMNSPNVVVSSRTVIKCCCGKVCKGARGLKMHQRSCRVIQGLDSEFRTDLEEQNNSDTENIPELGQSTLNETPTVEKEDIANLRKEHNIQKGFTPNMSGTLEHTAQMANIINKARIKQRSLVITLLDLKNAFGEVHHNLITFVLDYHHIPEHVKLIIKSLYTDFKTSIITSEFRTPFIPVRRGVLQGDCLSPLLFNMCFNTFIQHIKTDKYRQFGFSLQFLNPIHWFQFADDAAVISSQESENQHLLNRFSIWCQWSNMIIRVDKCSTFGIKKALSKSIQYLPKLNKQLIPKINIGEAFQYLGRYFSFNMSDEHHKSELISLVEELIADIDSKPLHPKNKILLYSRYLLSKLSWHFTVSSVSKTWVTENIDSKVNSYIRKWLDIPISGTLSTVFLTRNKFGLSICPPSVKFIQCQTVLRKALKTSPNEAINDLWKATSNSKNIQYDVYNSTKQVLKDFRSGKEDKLHTQLTCQGSFFTNITKFSLSQLTKIWSACQSNVPKNIFNFTVRYINNSLPTRQNLARWGLSPTSDCSRCLAPETLLHVVAGCQSYLERFTWRHDSVLNFLATYKPADRKRLTSLRGSPR
ncbi:Hypothetical predicted protein, partial [Paramuricea clavata]